MDSQLAIEIAVAVIPAVVLAFVSFAVLTIVGIWFRGPGMKLVWPWNA